MKQPLVILTGSTAVGKTALSVRLARAVDGEIISADSMQVYKGMDIGSAKIKPEEMQGIPHHLIDELEPDEPFHVVKFQELAKKYISEIRSRNRIPVLTGGTGFYIQAVLYDIDFTENQEEEEYRRFLEKEAREKGGEYLHGLLTAVDPQAAGEIHPHNIKRMIRALEFFHLTGSPISEHNARERERKTPYNAAYFVLNDRREEIYDRIDRRVDQMIQNGLVGEVESLKKRGFTRDMVSMQGLGYKEMLDYLEGKLSLEEAVRIIKRDTRHFAKRQLTWFRRERDVIWIQRDQYRSDEDAMLRDMLEILRERKIIPAACETV